MKLRDIGSTAGLAAALLTSTQAFAAGELIVNEYNAVGESKFLDFDTLKPWEGEDTHFGRIQGNGGNWIELVVASDHLDIRGWSIQWSNSDPDSGVVTLSNDARWSDLRAGTIITIIETTDDLVPEVANIQDNDYNEIADAIGTPFNVDTDFSFDPATDDWWINAWLSDASLFTTGSFKVDNDNWEVTLKDDLGGTVQGPIGEGLLSWTGGGINSREIGRLELDPSTAATPGNYDDADNSTFGAPNDWDDQAFLQDFSALRSWYVPGLPGDLDGDGFVGLADLDIILNNWNLNVPPANPDADPTGDNFVGLADLDIVLNNWNTGTPPAANAIPEPASLALLGLGGLAVLRRRA